MLLNVFGSERVRWVLGQAMEPSEEVSREEIEKLAEQIVTEEIEQQTILSEIRKEPRTIPEISSATGLPIKKVVRHIIDLRGAGVIAEVGEKEDYYLYGIIQVKR